MSTTEKISVAMGRDELRLARTVAQKSGLSLSAFVTEAVRDRLAEERRREAAREVLATFDAADLPGPERERELLAQWATPAPTRVRAGTAAGRRKPPAPARRR